jgi:Zn-dependent protease with chaperone function
VRVRDALAEAVSFFAQQEDARRHTLRLVLMFLAAVVAVIGAVDLTVTLGAWWLLDVGGLSRDFHMWLAIVLLAAIVVFAVKRLIALRGGGAAIAKMVKAREVKRSTTDPGEKRLLNITDEMAIASGLAAPSVYVMPDEKAINAFAAGYSPNQAVIVVTAGALEKLDRDELQGVIGHEFSHILNGDMRLNVRLIGILAGIVIVGEAGLVIIKLGAEAGDTGAIPFIVWGALVAAVGYIGVFFGRMIKAAVSRQRELLADASSVQFTRNPDGLLGALEKIRKDGAVIANPLAGEMSHMYFGQAISPKFFSDLFATHPPIEERIASITGRKLEAPAVAAQGIVGSILAMVGRATPEHVDHAAGLVAAIPGPVRQLLDTPEGARRVIYAYLFASEPAVRVIQVRALVDAGDGAMATGIDDLIKALREIGAASRLPVLSLAVPALRHMEGPARKAFLTAVDALIDADNEVTLGEFVIRTILGQQLSPATGRADRVKYATVKDAQSDMGLLIATLARAGASDRAAQENAFDRGMRGAGLKGVLPPDAKLDAPAMAAALGRLRGVAPLAKPAVMAACVETALADEKLLLPEMELLRAIGMAIDCPLPPALETLQV